LSTIHFPSPRQQQPALENITFDKGDPEEFLRGKIRNRKESKLLNKSDDRQKNFNKKGKQKSESGMVPVLREKKDKIRNKFSVKFSEDCFCPYRVVSF